MLDNPLFVSIADRSLHNVFQYKIDRTTTGIVYYGRALMDVTAAQTGWAIVREVTDNGITSTLMVCDDHFNNAPKHYKWDDRTGYFPTIVTPPNNVGLPSMYVLVQKRDFTETLLNRSVHSDVSELIEYESQGLWAKIFPITTKYYIIQVEKEELLKTSVYDNFEWFTEAEKDALLAAEGN